MLDDSFKPKCSVDLKKGIGKRKKFNDTGVIVVSSLCKPRQNVTSKMATPVTSYIHIWLNNAVTVFGNAIQTNVQRKFAREGTEV